jgi:hypothetical protein
MDHSSITARPARATDWQTVKWACAVFVLGALLSWARLPWPARKTVWAEDGRNFLGDFDELGFFGSLFNPHGGYLHVIPRLLAGAVASVDGQQYYSDLIALGSCVVVAGIAALVFVCSSAVTDWMPARLAIASITILVPTAPIEVLGNAANLHWYCLWAAIWLLLYIPRSVAGQIVLSLVALSFALTEITTAMLAPIVFYRFKEIRLWPVRIAFLVGLLGQLIATLSAPRYLNPTPQSPSSLIAGYFIECVTSIFFASERTAGSFLAHTGWWAGLVLFIPFALAALYVLWRGRGIVRITVIALLGVSILSWTAAAAANLPTGDYWNFYQWSDEQYRTLIFMRYGVIASMTLIPLPILAALTVRERLLTRAEFQGTAARHAAGSGSGTEVISASRADLRRWPRRPQIWVGVAQLVPLAMVCLMLISFTPETTRRDDQPDWASARAQAIQTCQNDPSVTMVYVPTAPIDAPWQIALRCDSLD